MATYQALENYLNKMKAINKTKDFMGRPQAGLRPTDIEYNEALADMERLMNTIVGEDLTTSKGWFVLNGVKVRLSTSLVSYITNRPAQFQISDEHYNTGYTQCYGTVAGLEKALRALLVKFGADAKRAQDKRVAQAKIAEDQDTTITLKLKSSDEQITLTQTQLVNFANSHHLTLLTILTQLTPEIMKQLKEEK